jgi:hypothetical protein
LKVAKRRKVKLFHVYPDERNTDMTMDEMRTILCRGFRKQVPSNPNAFRRVQFRKSNDVQALQVSDILIGALAYRLNRHYDRPGNDDKKALCEYILRKGDFWRFVSQSGFREKERPPFIVWFRRHKADPNA